MRKWPEGSITLLIEKGFRSSKLKAKDELVTLSPIFPNTTYIFFLPTCTYIILVANSLFYWRRRRKSRFVFKLLDPFNLKNIFLFKTAKKNVTWYSFNCYFSFCSFAQKNETFCYLYISFVLSPSSSSWFRFWMQVFTQVTRAHITAKDLPCIIAYKANLKPNAHAVPLRAIHHDLLQLSFRSYSAICYVYLYVHI